MALADIVRRIAEDASHEADTIVRSAEEAAERTRADAYAKAAAQHERTVESARRAATEGAQARLARARITARDRALASRREMVDRTLAETVTRLESLPADEYADFIVRKVAGVARGGERLLVAEADAHRLVNVLAVALANAGIEIEEAGTTAALSRGVVLEGDRVRVEVSPAAVVAGHAEDMVSVIAAELFDRGE
ncbi:MAG: hypothetical protein KGZ40_02715 [Clostridiales bacterium]|nr:hypothetical protein [Clostridiales bacterium]